MAGTAIAAVTRIAITTTAISRAAIKESIAATSFSATRTRAAIAGVPARAFFSSLLFLSLALLFL